MLTAFERNFARRMMPFYVWTRRNAPHMFELLAKSPGKMTPIGHLVETGRAATDYDESVSPDWLRDLFPVPTPIEGETGKQFFATAGVLPIAEVGDILSLFKGGPKELPENFVREVIGRMPPMLKLPLELAFQKDIYFQQDLKGYKRAPGYVEFFDDRVHGVPMVGDVWDVVKELLGIFEKQDEGSGEPYLVMGAEAVKVMRDLVPWMNTVGKLLSEAPRRKNDILKALTGISSVQYNEEEFGRQQQYADLRELEDLVTSLRQSGQLATSSEGPDIAGLLMQGKPLTLEKILGR